MIFSLWRSPRAGFGSAIAVTIVVLVASSSSAWAVPVDSSPPASPTAGASPVAGPTPAPTLVSRWLESQLELSQSVTNAPSNSPPVFCSPCHAPQVSLVVGVASTPIGLIASGIERPPAVTAIWRSTDSGSTWQRVADVPARDSSGGLAVASNGDRIVVVGRDATGAAVWSSTDGDHWAVIAGTSDLAGPAGGTGMTSVTPWKGGFVAVGANDDPIHATTAGGVWISSDGQSWRHVGAGNPAFAGAHILGVAASADRLVAVGTTHDETQGAGRAWVSLDGQTWVRADAGLENGVPRAVAATPDGFIAVGLRSDDAGAMVWRSTDGSSWVPVADQPAFHAGTSPVRLMTVVVRPDEIVAAGWRADTAFGEAFALRSTDGGETFSADPTDNSFYGAEFNGMAATPAGIAAVGVVGYPDNDQGAAWQERPLP